MSRLIDAEALARHLYDEYHGAISDSTLYVYEIIRLLDAAPTIEPKLQTGNFIAVRCADTGAPFSQISAPPTAAGANEREGTE